MENLSARALPRGEEKQKKTEQHFDRGSAPGKEKQNGRKMENNSSGALPRKEEKKNEINLGTKRRMKSEKMSYTKADERKKNIKPSGKGFAPGGRKEK